MVGLQSQIRESKTTVKIKSNMKEKLFLDCRMLMPQLEEGSYRSLSDSLLVFSRTEVACLREIPPKLTAIKILKPQRNIEVRGVRRKDYFLQILM